MSKGLKRKASSQQAELYRVLTKQRGVDSESDDTVSVDSEDSRRPRSKQKLYARKNSSESKPSLQNRESSLGGVVTAFLALRSRTIVRETIPEEDSEPPKPRKMLSAKRRILKKSSTLSEFGPIAAPSGLHKKFSEARAATVM